jgi:hypothetical protein
MGDLTPQGDPPGEAQAQAQAQQQVGSRGGAEGGDAAGGGDGGRPVTGRQRPEEVVDGLHRLAPGGPGEERRAEVGGDGRPDGRQQLGFGAGTGQGASGEEDTGQGVVPRGGEAGSQPTQDGGGRGEIPLLDGRLCSPPRRLPGIVQERRGG